jgi:hypothetical protein
VAANDRAETIRALNDWRTAAPTVRAFVSAHGGEESLGTAIQDSLALAGQAKTLLVENRRTTPTNATKQVRTAIEEVCRDVPIIAAQLKAKIGGKT